MLDELDAWRADQGSSPRSTNAEQQQLHESFEAFGPRLASLRRHINEIQKLTARTVEYARKELAAGSSDERVNKEVRRSMDALDEHRHVSLEAVRAATYPFSQITWLQSRFPDALIADVPGLCRVVTREEIAAQDHSLTPGRYVGIAQIGRAHV